MRMSPFGATQESPAAMHLRILDAISAIYVFLQPMCKGSTDTHIQRERESKKEYSTCCSCVFFHSSCESGLLTLYARSYSVSPFQISINLTPHATR